MIASPSLLLGPMLSNSVLELYPNLTSFFFQSYCQRHSLNQKRKDSDDSEDESKGKRKHMTAEERSLARRQKYVLLLKL